METKDLILLMLIPLLAISLIVYTDKSPVIIGAVTAEQEQNNIIGSYSINHSFKANTNIEYSLNDYASIKQTLDKIIEDCKNSEFIGQCLRDKSTEHNWNCDGQRSKDETTAILYDFVDKFSECMSLEGNNVICRFSLDERELSDTPLYTLELKKEINRIRAELKSSNNEVIETVYLNQRRVTYVDNYDSKEIKQGDLARSVIKYSGNKPNIYNAYVLLGGETKINFVDERKNVESRNMFLFYKTTDELGNGQVSFIDFQVQTSFRAPSPANNIIDLPKTKGIKFCAKTGKKIYAFDASDNQVKLRDVVYKFAVTYPDFPPQPLKNVEAFDKPKADKSILVKWENSSDSNVVKYRIYFAESSLNVFDKTPTDDLKKNPKITFKDVELEPSVNFEGNLAPNECVFDYPKRKCSFSTSNGENPHIESNKLHYSKAANSYFYSIVLPSDNTNYDIGITAVGKTNNEINNKDEDQKIPVVKSIQSIDDLPPDSLGIVQVTQQTFKIIKTPDKNIDGSALNDLKEYKVYYTKKQSLTQPQKGELVNSIRESKLSQLVLLTNVNAQNQFSIDLTQTSPQTGDIYFFVVVASDNSGNPKEGQFRVKEFDAIPAELDI